jgi:hypothetical protein
MCIGLHVNYLLFLSEFSETWIFSTDFRKPSIYNFMQIHPVGAEVHADWQNGQADKHDTANSAHFCEST